MIKKFNFLKGIFNIKLQFVMAVFIITTSVFAQENVGTGLRFHSNERLQNPPFDANEIIERVSQNHSLICHSDPELVSGEESDIKNVTPSFYSGRALSETEGLNETLHFADASFRVTDRGRSRTGEFLLDTNVVYKPGIGDQSFPAIAFDGTNYLVAWTDLRSGEPYIYCARINQAGIVLDPVGIAISTATYVMSGPSVPSVAFDGANYLVVWHNELFDIYGARVSQSAVVLDTSGFAISTSTGEQKLPSIAFDGTNYLVVWQDSRNGSYTDIYGARVSQSGVVLDPDGIVISTAADDQFYPAIAFDNTNYLVVWFDYRNLTGDIYGARVNPSGIVLDPDGIAISPVVSFQDEPSVAFDGTNYLVAWQDYQNGAFDIYGARVTQAGAVLDSTGIAISTAANHQLSSAIAFDGANYLVVWTDWRSDSFYRIYGARVSSSGAVLDPGGIPISTVGGDQSLPAIAFDNANYLVVWGNGDIYGARVNPSGIVLDSVNIVIATTTYDQWYPSSAFDGANYLVVWTDRRDYLQGHYAIYGARVNQSGIVLDPQGIAISSLANYQILPPSGAFDGTNYLVVWEDWGSSPSGYNIYGARVSQSGVVLDTSGIAISAAVAMQNYPTIAFGGMNYLAVWEDWRNPYYSDIYGARVNQSSIVLDTAGIAISTAGGYQFSPSLAFDGTNYLVVWYDSRNPSSYDIYGAPVNPSGEVLDTAGIAISTAPGWQRYPSIAFDGINYLIVWEDGRNLSQDYSDIYGARVNQSGVVLDPDGIAISTAENRQYSPSVAFDGTNYLVVWQDLRRGLSYDIYGARVNTEGIIIDSFVVSSQLGDRLSPAVAHGAGEQFLITYSGWCDYINGHPANTMRIWGKFYPFTSIEEDAEYRIHEAGLKLSVYPNPFTQKTEIRCTMQDTRCKIEDFSLKIYDVSGRLVKDLLRFTTYDGRSTSIVWSGDDDFGRKLPAGVYFVRFESEEYTGTEKIIKLR